VREPERPRQTQTRLGSYSRCCSACLVLSPAAQHFAQMQPHGAWCMGLLAAVLASAALAGTAAADVDVCVIGAGPAGIGAALGLASKGKSFVLLERNGWVGCVAIAPPASNRALTSPDSRVLVSSGQTSPEYRDPATGSRLHMGAVVLTPPDYPLLMELANFVGLGVQPYSTGQGAYLWGASGPVSIITAHANASGTAPVYLRHAADDFPGLAYAMQRYGQLRRDLMPLLLNPGGLSAVLRARPELAVNGDAWLQANHLSVVAPICAPNDGPKSPCNNPGNPPEANPRKPRLAHPPS
jgi:hypothetical protein